MPRKLYRYVKGQGLVELKHEAPSEPFHAVIGDDMPQLLHPADNKVYSSKSAFRRVTKLYGYTEVGNDLISKQKPRPAEKRPMSEAFKKALWDNIDKALSKK
jgi:hypothetical protein